jgi:hypothetical protein
MKKDTAGSPGKSLKMIDTNFIVKFAMHTSKMAPNTVDAATDALISLTTIASG